MAVDISTRQLEAGGRQQQHGWQVHPVIVDGSVVEPDPPIPVQLPDGTPVRRPPRRRPKPVDISPEPLPYGVPRTSRRPARWAEIGDRRGQG